MEWRNKIVNKDEAPKDQIWVSIQYGKADYYHNHSAWAERDKVLSFPTKETAEYFIQHWDKTKMYDYKQACLNADHVFWVYDKCPNGYYADYINVYKDEEDDIFSQHLNKLKD